MTISTYQTLQDAAANWIHRPGDPTMAARIKDCISLCEAKLSADISGRSMEIRTTLTATPASPYLVLPTDIVEIRRLTVSSTNPVQVMKYLTPDQISKDYPATSTGSPVVYTINGGQAQLAPIPDSAYSIELTYFQRIPALSDANTTNWVLTTYPNAYLYGTLAEAMPYLQDDERTALFKKLYQEAVDAINKIDWYTGSTMIVRAS